MNKRASKLAGRILAVVSLIFVLAPLVFADTAKNGRFFTFYYLSPQPTQVASAFAGLDTVASPLNDNAAWPLGMFLSEVFRTNPEVAKQMVKQAGSHSTSGRYAIALGICQSDLPNRPDWLDTLLPGQKLTALREELKSSPFEPLDEISPYSPEVLDALWGAFMASGNTIYVKTIISALDSVAGGEGNANDKVTASLISEAARWSLASNAIQHERVLEVCREQLGSKDISPKIKTILEDIIQKAEAARK